MPELAEIARIVHHLRSNLRNQTIASVTCPQEDPIIFQTPKTGLTIDTFAKQLAGRKIIDAKQQGKYFWLVMDKPPHPLMHFGMTGWIKFRGAAGAGVDYRRMQDEKTRDKMLQDDNTGAEVDNDSKENEEWPPRFWKFNIVTKADPPIEASFVDGRRLGRVRLIDCAAEEMRNVSPLKENGPDPVVDQDRFTLHFITDLVRKRKVPVKALLLDQGAISGIGNWMADEILYHAAIHPGVYANALTDSQIKALHKQIEYVCKTAVDLLADSSKFPPDWLMKYRWDKGKKNSNTLPNGDKIVHVEVGGRTSAIVPTRQKKSDTGDAEEYDEDTGDEEKPAAKASAKGAKRKKQEDDEADEKKTTPAKKSRKSTEAADSKKADKKSAPKAGSKKETKAPATGSRRSSRRRSGN